MILGQKICVVLPAYNAEKTLLQTVEEIPREYIDDVILVDDASTDQTALKGKALGLYTVTHEQNLGYGGNQKTCYSEALKRGADVVIMLHPDYQYTPKLIPAMASMIALGLHDFVLGSRVLGGHAMQGGMPWWRYFSNRFLTMVQNLMLGAKLSEYHTGYRAYSRRLLESMNFEGMSDDFIFDNEFIAQALWNGCKIGEVSCPTKYFTEASSINFRRSCLYGLGCLRVSLQYRWAKLTGTRPSYAAGAPQRR